MKSLDAQLDDALEENEGLKAENATLRAELESAKAPSIAPKEEKQDASSVVDKLLAIQDPMEQTAFIRALSPSERGELFSNIPTL